jgi:hypothetical protein
MSEAGEGPAPQWFSHPASLLAALYLYTPGARPFALSRPDALSPLVSVSGPCSLLCPRTPAHNTRRYEHRSPVVLANRGGSLRDFDPTDTPPILPDF